MTTLRSELEPLPSLMTGLPVRRGYPVPWFVAWIDGAPEFRAMDPRKFRVAVKEGRCWVCGNRFVDKLGFRLSQAFVVGPMCAVNRISSEPPSHHICASWSARNCPFLSRPYMARREDDLINEASIKDRVAGVAITRNPGVALVWPTSTWTLIRDGRGRPLFQFGSPDAPLEWYAEGRRATRAEVMASLETGLPALQEACDLESTAELQALAHRELETAYQRALVLAPPL